MTTKDITDRQYQPNPALKGLEGFVGDWDIEVSRASFLPDLSAAIDGYATVEWFETGACLVIRQQGEKPFPPFSTWIIGRDEATELYTVLYSDTRGVSRIYDMSFDQGVWKMWRDDPSFFQRFTGTFSKDHKSITAQWENSSDGKTWEHDFDLTYTKIRQRKGNERASAANM